jgi:hypothetical protein
MKQVKANLLLGDLGAEGGSRIPMRLLISQDFKSYAVIGGYRKTPMITRRAPRGGAHSLSLKCAYKRECAPCPWEKHGTVSAAASLSMSGCVPSDSLALAAPLQQVGA